MALLGTTLRTTVHLCHVPCSSAFCDFSCVELMFVDWLTKGLNVINSKIGFHKANQSLDIQASLILINGN